MNNFWKQVFLPLLSLFTSVGTLLCCALPALLVILGMGSALAGLISIAPWVTVISKYKLSIFIIAAILLLLSATIQWRNRNAPCPTDPLKAKACQRMRAINWVILGIAFTTYVIGFFFAFIAAALWF